MNTEAVANLVRATDPHVASLVEVDESWDGPSALDELAVREFVAPWLLLGDFNTAPSSWLDGRPTLRAYPVPPEATYPRRAPVEAIDCCVAPEGLEVRAEVLQEAGSHFAGAGAVST